MYKLQLKAWSIYGKWQTLCFCCSNRHYLLHDPFKKLRHAENFLGGVGDFRGGDMPGWNTDTIYIKTARRCIFRRSLPASLRINHVDNYVQPWPSELIARRVWYPGACSPIWCYISRTTCLEWLRSARGVAAVIDIALKSQLHTAPLSGSEHFRTFI